MFGFESAPPHSFEVYVIGSAGMKDVAHKKLSKALDRAKKEMTVERIWDEIGGGGGVGGVKDLCGLLGYRNLSVEDPRVREVVLRLGKRVGEGLIEVEGGRFGIVYR